MTDAFPIADFGPEQQELWSRVNALWAMTKEPDADRIRAALHPRYVGWDMSGPLPHDRDAAVRSVPAEAPELRRYELQPLSVQVYDERVGVVHYAYSATVVAKGGHATGGTGKWTEVYLRQGGEWTLISASGRPDATPPAA